MLTVVTADVVGSDRTMKKSEVVGSGVTVSWVGVSFRVVVIS